MNEDVFVVITHDPARPRAWVDRARDSCAGYEFAVVTDIHRMGPAHCRNTALWDAGGMVPDSCRTLVYLDDDDWFVDGGIDRLVAPLRERTYSCATGGHIAVNLEDGTRAEFLDKSHAFDGAWLREKGLTAGVKAFDRAKLIACGGYHPGVPYCSSFDVLIRYVDMHGPGVVIYPAVYHKGLHGGNRLKHPEQPEWFRWVASQPVRKGVSYGHA